MQLAELHSDAAWEGRHLCCVVRRSLAGTCQRATSVNAGTEKVVPAERTPTMRETQT